MAPQRPEWAAWLREQFDRHKTIRTNADLSRAGGEKENGRPRIDPSSVTQWMRGRRPSYELAVATAEAFGAPVWAALVAAGYQHDAERTPLTTEQALRVDRFDVHFPGGVSVVIEDDEIRYQRPEGISDQEWATRRKAAQATIHALFEEYET